MLVGNFDFMYDSRNQEYYSGFADQCADVEEKYAQGDYETAVIKCRKAIELIVRWTFDFTDFGLPSAMADSYVRHSDRLNDHIFRKWLRDSYLWNNLDRVRIIGNKNMHNIVDTDAKTARFCLNTLFDLVLALEKHLWDQPYSAAFIEPYYEQDDDPVQGYDGPANYDYLALIKKAQENGDAETAARWALLNKVNDRGFILAPYATVLPDNSPVGMLIRILSDKHAFENMICDSSIRLNQLIFSCYGNWDYELLETISLEAIRKCRKITAKNISETDEYITETEAKLEAMRNGK